MREGPHWCLDLRDRVIKIDASGQHHYVYGIGCAPRCGVARELSPADGEAMFDAQRSKMWDDVKGMLPVAQREARRQAGRGTQAYDELMGNVAVLTLCRAVVLWVPDGRTTLRTYCHRCLRNEYRRYLGRRHESQLRQLDAGVDIAAKSPPGQDAAEELCSLGLSSDELQLLYDRYDSEESLQQMADRLGCAKQTVKNRLRKIMRGVRLRVEERDDPPGQPETLPEDQ